MANLGPHYRRRTCGILAATLLFTLAIMATQTWLIHHPVRELEMAPLRVTSAIIAGGAVGVLGFPLGRRLAESWGRRVTFAVATILYAPAAAIGAQFAAGGLALWLGGLAPAVSVLGLLMLPAALVFLARVPETSGLGLEAAALEDEPDEAGHPAGSRVNGWVMTEPTFHDSPVPVRDEILSSALFLASRLAAMAVGQRRSSTH